MTQKRRLQSRLFSRRRPLNSPAYLRNRSRAAYALIPGAPISIRANIHFKEITFMRIPFKFLALVVALALAPAALTRADLKTDDQGFTTLQAGEEVWGDYPGIAGIKRMVVYGDPSKPGVYVIRAKFAPGVMSMPHTHPEDRLVTVIRGTWWSGTGEEFTPDKTVAMHPGAFMRHPAGEAHFDGAKQEEVVVQLIGSGPSGTKFIHPELGTVGKSL